MNILLIIILTLFAIFSRLIPHPPNFTPLLAIALYSGVCFKNKFLFIIPLLSMVISDFFIGYHNTIFWVYLSLLIIFYIGYLLFKKYTFRNLILLSFVSSIMFFILSNLGVWIIGYPKSFEGFIACYVAAIPFFHNTLISTFAYLVVLKLLFDLAVKKKIFKASF